MNNFELDKRYYYGVRVLAVLGVVAVLLRVLSTAISPDGYLIIKSDINNPSPFISEPKPYERIDFSHGAPFRVIGDPIYFDLNPPANFEKVTISARYLNRNQQVIELGALVNRTDGQFDMRPAENRLIDMLNWHRSTSGKFTLLQRNRTYEGLDEFLVNPPDIGRVATYRANIDWRYYSENQEESDNEPKRRIVSLRGHHRILTYVNQAPLSFTFFVQDMNRQDGADPVIVSVYHEGDEKPLARSVLQDDGNTTDDQQSVGLRTIAISVPDAEAGLYRVELTAPDDIFIRELVTKQSKFVFMNRLYLGDHVGYSDLVKPVTLLVGGRTLIAKTAHNEGLQTLSVGNSKLDVKDPHVRYFSWLDSNNPTIPVISTKRDILFESDGLFALHVDDFFNPLPDKMEWYMTNEDVISSKIDFIITEYEQPKLFGEYSVAQATFDIDSLATTEEGLYRFVLDAPGIGVTGRELYLESIMFVLQREPTDWLSGLKQLFSGGKNIREAKETGEMLPDGRSYSEIIR